MLTQKNGFLAPAMACAAMLVVSAVWASDSLASGAGSAIAGHALAERLCARCHAIEGAGPGPAAEAPAFTGIARQWPPEQLREAFAEGVMVGHGPVEMPTFELEPGAIDDLVAYLNSLSDG
jgi:mono/diheme cytochrome c family protein